VISSSNPRLNTAVAGAAEDFRFEVPEGCNKLRYDILFRR